MPVIDLDCKLYISKSTDPWYNLAVEEQLLCSLLPGEVILYLWQNADTIVVGRNQNAWRECRVEEFERSGGRLARRLSGGGAVYHDLGNQNFTFLAKSELYDVKRQTEVIRLAAASLGIKATRSGRNDILADGKKFSGNAYYCKGENHYHHGTVLISSDMERLGSFLRPSPHKLEAKGVASARARVVNLSQLAPGLTAVAMRTALIEAMKNVYTASLGPLEKGRINTDLVAELATFYASDAWRLGRKNRFSHEICGRLSFGEISIGFTIERGTIKNVIIHTDALHSEWLSPLQEAMVDAPHTGDALTGRVSALAGDYPEMEELAAFLKGKLR